MTRPNGWKNCTVACETMPECSVCGRRKKPSGRSAPLEMANGLCDHDCHGYHLDPKPGHLWPGELAQMDEEPKP